MVARQDYDRLGLLLGKVLGERLELDEIHSAIADRVTLRTHGAIIAARGASFTTHGRALVPTFECLGATLVTEPPSAWLVTLLLASALMRALPLALKHTRVAELVALLVANRVPALIRARKHAISTWRTAMTEARALVAAE